MRRYEGRTQHSLEDIPSLTPEYYSRRRCYAYNISAWPSMTKWTSRKDGSFRTWQGMRWTASLTTCASSANNRTLGVKKHAQVPASTVFSVRSNDCIVSQSRSPTILMRVNWFVVVVLPPVQDRTGRSISVFSYSCVLIHLCAIFSA